MVIWVVAAAAERIVVAAEPIVEALLAVRILEGPLEEQLGELLSKLGLVPMVHKVRLHGLVQPPVDRVEAQRVEQQVEQEDQLAVPA